MTSSPTVIRDVWMDAATRLEDAGISDARFEAEVLLRHVSGCSRADLYAKLADPIEPEVVARLGSVLQRRIAREPLSYITGTREFYRLEFRVSPAVLVPRPESELLVETALEHLRGQRARRARVVDVGTGSGALGISVGKHRRDIRLLLTDVSAEALAVARENARALIPRRRADFLRGDLLTAVNGPLDCVLANLPYVPEDRLPELEPEVAEHEPRGALSPGTAGTELILRLVTQLGSRLAPRGIALIEIDPGQEDVVAAAVRRLMTMADVEVLDDLSGQPRAVRIVAN